MIADIINQMLDELLFLVGQGPIYPALWIPLLSMLLYWFCSQKVATFKRLLVSAHGIFIYLAFAYAIAVSPVTNSESCIYWIWPFEGLILLALIFDIYTIIRFTGSKWIHLVQILVLPSWFFIWFVGSMEISHDWM